MHNVICPDKEKIEQTLCIEKERYTCRKRYARYTSNYGACFSGLRLEGRGVVNQYLDLLFYKSPQYL